ncbi:hypothetical protein [Xanthomonas phage SB3]|uniref:Uncharacterized protein n=1 Tax=Xanthomonas phage SB3 TaxID=3117472 RepID=A0ABZ2GUK9_9CAUD
MSSKQAILLCASFRRKVAWGGEDFDAEAALKETVDSVYSMYTEAERADLYARLIEGGFLDNAGALSRKLIAKVQINRWSHARVYAKPVEPTTEKKEFKL